MPNLFEFGPLAFFVWLFATLAASALIARPITMAYDQAKSTRAYFWAATLCLHLLLMCTVPLALTFLKVNTPVLYIAIALGLLAAILYPSRIRPAWDDVRRVLHSAQPAYQRTLTAALALLFIPPLMFNIAPITETDSLGPASAIIAFAHNALSPNHLFLSGTSQFWEFSYLPSYVLTRTDRYFWLSSFEAVVLFAICAYLVSVSLSLRRPLCVLLAANAAAVYHFWFGPAGVMTLKVDMIDAAGVLVLVLACLMMIQGNFGRLTALLAVSGTAFVITKLNGPFFLVGLLSITASIVYTVRRHVFRRFLSFSLATSLCAIVISGHLYVYNLFHYHNPFYPVDLPILSLHLPGRLSNLQATSIFAHIREGALWKTLLFSSSRGVHYGGALFALELLVFFLLVAPVSARKFLKLVRGCPTEKTLVIGLVGLFGWLLYFAAPWSAGNTPTDFYYLSPMASLRYALPFLFLSEAWLVALVPANRRAVWLTGAVLAVSFLSRMYILYFQLPLISALNVSGVLAGPCGRASEIVVSVVGIMCLAVVVFRWRGGLRAVLAVTATGVLLAAPGIVEANRKIWLAPWQFVTKVVAFAEPAEVFAINQWDNQRLMENLYIEGGIRAQHHLTYGSVNDLKDYLKQRANPPRFVIFASFVDYSTSKIERLSKILAAIDYAPLGANSRSGAFEYAPGVRLGELGQAGLGKAAYCPHEACLPPTPVATGLEYVGATGDLYYAQDGHLRTIIGSEGEKSSIGGMGGEYPNGSWTGLPITWNRMAWDLDQTRVQEIMAAFTVTRFPAGKAPGPGWSIAGNIRHDSTILKDREGSAVRIRALETRPDGWLALVYSGPQLTAKTDFSLDCEVRSLVKQVYLQSFDFGPKGVIGTRSLLVSGAEQWSHASLGYGFRDAATGSYMAIAIFGVKNEEFLDLRYARVLKGRWLEGVPAKEQSEPIAPRQP